MIICQICVFLALTVVAALANGGGYFRGGVESTGNIHGFEPKDTEKIRIVDEILTVALGSHSANVEVRYLMRNETDRKVRVKFGFPVEESCDTDLMIGAPSTAPSPSVDELRYCQNYVISAAGKAVKARWHGERKPSKDQRFEGIAGWYVSEMVFSAGEEKQVFISFLSGYPMEAWDVSDQTSETAGKFRYRLSTAACWAGAIRAGKITLKPDGIDPRELKVLKPVNRFKKDGDSWVWNFENLEPTMADDLEVEAYPETRGYNDTSTSRINQRGNIWIMSHANYQVVASSELPPADGQTYGAENVKSLWGQSTWSEGADGDGIGEWLELKPKVPKPLIAMSLFPGYFRTEELFLANARPKTMSVLLNGERRFTVGIADRHEAIRIPVVNYAKPVKTIRLTMEEVWPGSKYEDLCVSGVMLEVKLDKRPKIEQAR